MEIIMIQDQILPLRQGQISAHDRSIYFGDGVYEALRYCGDRLFMLEEHMSRLEYSLGEMDMLGKVDLCQVRGRVDRAVQIAGIDDAIVYFQISRGPALRDHDYPEDWQPNFLLQIRRYKPSLASGEAITHPDWRWKRCDIKSLNLLANVLARHKAHQQGAYEAILVDEEGHITEATSSSVFLVEKQTLKVTPLGRHVLAGITRHLLVQWAGELGLEIQEGFSTPEQSLAADELLITGTSSNVMAITKLDGHPIAGGGVGEVTGELQKKLRQEMYGKSDSHS